MDVLEAVVLQVQQCVHQFREELEQFAFTVVSALLQSARQRTLQRVLEVLQVGEQVEIVGAEVLALALGDVVNVEDMGVVREFGGAHFEFAEAVFHQELVGVAEDLQEAVLLLLPQQGQRAQVRQLVAADRLRLTGCLRFVPHLTAIFEYNAIPASCTLIVRIFVIMGNLCDNPGREECSAQSGPL